MDRIVLYNLICPPRRRSWRMASGRLSGLLITALLVGTMPRAAPAQETIIDLEPIAISTNTGEKPQSKVWRHGDRWWAVLPSDAFSGSANDGTWLWRLEESYSWINVLKLSSNSGTKADTVAVGDVTHVLLYDGTSTELVSVEYDEFSGVYTFWSQRPTVTPLSLSSSEIATIDVDSTGRMWLATENGTNVVVHYSDPPYRSFTGPIVVESGIASDDISVITALPNHTIGVLWSNQNDEQFGFRVHQDGAAPTVWLADEVPAADTFSHGVADDHLNVAVASDGTLFAAVKTSFNTSGHAQIAMLVRRPDGSGPGGFWENQLEPEEVFAIDDAGTRAIVLLNEEANNVRVVYTADTGGADIVYRDSPMQPIHFGSRHSLMNGSLNNATSTKMNWIDQVVILASRSSSAEGVLITRNGGASTTTTSTTTTTALSTTTTTEPCVAGVACQTGQPGICGPGVIACQADGPVCMQTAQPGSEVCDGVDNDCDGSVDDGNPGGGLSCSTGELGACASGTTDCQGGALVCVRNQSPSAEVCDGVDNDCDGSVDDGNPGGGISCSTGELGVCASGTADCQGGVLICVSDESPAPDDATCDGRDDDCDGAVDEDVTCPAGQVCQPAAGQCDFSIVTVEVRVSATSDDAEEQANGSVDLNSSDLELILEHSAQTIGIRFAGLTIPPAAVIRNAYIEFQVDEATSELTDLFIRGENVDDAPAFTTAPQNISTRSTTPESIPWSPPPWPSVGLHGSDQQTPDIAAIIQRIVNRTGWSSGNALGIIITGSGKRVAESYDGVRSAAPLLHVEYVVDPSATTTTTTSTTTTAPPGSTTTTTLPPQPAALFCDDFDSGLGNWTETGDGDWNTESLHSTSGYPSSGSGSPAAHSDNCDGTCTITLASPVDLQGRSAAELTLLRFVDSALDSGEYLLVQAWTGSTWQTLADWSASNGSDTNQWHAHTFDLAAYLGLSDFRIRFVTHESSRSEHVQVDDVCITATSAGPATTTTTTAPPTTTTTSGPATTTTSTTPATTTTTLPRIITAQVIADARTEENNPNTNFGTDTLLRADANSEKNTFIKISVSGTAGVVNSAALILTVADISRAASDSGGRVRPASCSWDESTLTFNNQPATTGTPGPSLGPVTHGQAVAFDLNDIITGDGTFCIAITNDSSDGVDYNSREAAANRPVVVLD